MDEYFVCIFYKTINQIYFFYPFCLGLSYFISWFMDLPTQYFCTTSPGHFLKYDCICHLHDVFSKLKYDNKLNLRYWEIIGGNHKAYFVFSASSAVRVNSLYYHLVYIKIQKLYL